MVTNGQLSRGFGGIRDKFDSIIPPPRIENCLEVIYIYQETDFVISIHCP
jgi:hypothetical protein